ncbi:S1/P1 Nuclease [Sphingobacterium sp. DK4209]|uniref:S1/P1 Nuclease n=1 Tax=Sphingobacterium zhuxiongii TaxID=2662364 RepID=A0A5Q0Q9J2_9SPHI|nr:MULTISPECIES: S1/P1 nuclease [unclassified Sphingobacterium]MVZ64462.1 S1/P1 Nuclease [Sphingobacterium sp. DK4209]QGA25799.1 S1/P1 Nuclease [Sphingobacterium sp. dk4302]
MKTVAKIVLFFMLLTSSQQLFAWGTTGHRVISEIAEKHLSRKAKRNIESLIGKQKIAYWSNWADFIKSSPDPLLNSTGSWHFLNTAGNLNFQDFNTALQNSPDQNLYKAYARVKAQLADKKLSVEERRQALYYVIHLLGDAHQPMHVSRAEDLGGNKIDITFFGRPGNIHRVWDSDLVDNEKYSFIEYAAVLDYDKSFFKKYTQSSFEQWLYESHQLANVIYDDVVKQNKLSYDYIYRFKYPMEECLLKAGLRLAKELNEIFG